MDYQAYRAQLQRRFPAPSLPFEAQEYAARLTRVRQAMADSEVDVLLGTSD